MILILNQDYIKLERRKYAWKLEFELKKNLRVIEITTIWAKSAQKSIISTDFPEVAETVMCRVDGGPPFACKYFHCVV